MTALSRRVSDAAFAAARAAINASGYGSLVSDENARAFADAVAVAAVRAALEEKRVINPNQPFEPEGN